MFGRKCINHLENVLWREWRHCKDPEFADRLFETVADRPVGWMVKGLLMLAGAVYGGAWTLLLTLRRFGEIIVNNDRLYYTDLGKMQPIYQPTSHNRVDDCYVSVIGFGIVIGILFLLLDLTRVKKRLTWRVFLKMIPVYHITIITAIISSANAAFLCIGTAIGFFLWWQAMRTSHTDYYRHRSWYFWWRVRPNPSELESAIDRAAQEGDAQAREMLECLRAAESDLSTQTDLEQVIRTLKSPDWRIRWAARHVLARWGGSAVQTLLYYHYDNPPLITWLLRAIAKDTCHRFAKKVHLLLCPDCLARFGPHPIRLLGRSARFYGCRVCRQSQRFIEAQGDVVAALEEPSSLPGNPGGYRINWLQFRALFDFDRVEIVETSDEEVERFAVQVGNDTDPYRRPRYAKMTCRISARCRLSENTLKILANTFGKVERNTLRIEEGGERGIVVKG